jgi:7-cyano-7-deazaguanine synthase in queuosine biosynthesis
MIIKTSQCDININLHSDIKNVGIKLSGGADSALVCYLLSLYVQTERSDIRIVPISVSQIGKSFQIENAKRIIQYCTDKFGNIFFHHYTDETYPESVIDVQKNLVNSLYNRTIIDCHFSGITLNPPDDSIPQKVYDNGFKLPRSEIGIIDRTRTNTIKPNRSGRSYYPLINIDKRGVADIYRDLSLTDTLFPLTRSCEAMNNELDYHCGECWFCNERLWGFGKL